MKKSTRKITDPTLLLLKIFASPVIKFLMNTTITANQVTIANFLFCIPAATYLFFLGGFANNIGGLLLIVLYSFFDLVDGELARQKNMQSALGHWLDVSLDTILQSLIMFAIAANIIMGGGESWRMLALVPLFGQGIANVLGMRLTLDFGVDPFAGHRKLDILFNRKRSAIDSFLRNMLIPTNKVYLYVFTLRLYMFVGILLDMLPMTFVIFGIPILIRSFCLYLLLSLHYGYPHLAQKFATLQYLKKMNA